jgi:hypothetical protein
MQPKLYDFATQTVGANRQITDSKEINKQHKSLARLHKCQAAAGLF